MVWAAFDILFLKQIFTAVINATSLFHQEITVYAEKNAIHKPNKCSIIKIYFCISF